MRITEISFCDKVGYNIRSDETKKHILDTIEEKYKIKIVTKHFEKFTEERSIHIVNNNPHLACVRSNGNPYFLFITRHNNNEIAVFIDKKVQHGYFLPRMIISHIMIGKDRSIHDDTLFDGEMVKTTDGKWIFLINDLMVYKGQYLCSWSLPKRINQVYEMLADEYIPNEMSAFQIGVKRFFTFDQLKTDLHSHVENLYYTCRGVYFKPLHLKFKDILWNFDDSLIKKVKREKIGGSSFLLSTNQEVRVDESTIPSGSLSPVTPLSLASPMSTESSIPIIPHNIVCNACTHQRQSFATRKTATPDVYEMLDKHNKVQGIACIPSMKISKAMRDLFADKNLVDRIDIPFEYNPKFQKWIPIVKP